MAQNRVPVRTRAIRPASRDENIIAKHMRQSSNAPSAPTLAAGVKPNVVFSKPGGNPASKLPATKSVPTGKTVATAGAAIRPALNELSNKLARKPVLGVKDGDVPLKQVARPRSGSATQPAASQPARRVPLASIPKAQQQQARKSLVTAARRVLPQSHAQKAAASRIAVHLDVDELAEEAAAELDMDVEDERAMEAEHSVIVGEEEVELMVNLDEDGDVEVTSARDEFEIDELVHDEEEQTAKVQLSNDAVDVDAVAEELHRVWPDMPTAHRKKCEAEVDRVRSEFVQETFDAEMDPSMVSEYADEIFEYMQQLEADTMPDPSYIEAQHEITWEMRQTLVDWLLQVHLRYHMLPETLWIAVNIVDRFLTKRVVSLVKLQLVGVTAMFIAAKYEEILAPSVDEFVFMTEKGYTREEILKGERIVLSTLEFRVSDYCSPYSWMRKISAADEYDIQTRTLSKFLTEVTLLDHRFLGCRPSLVAAVGMYTARRMLGGDWDRAFIYHSGFTEEQLAMGFNLLVDKMNEDGFDRLYVYKKYANKRFLKASQWAVDWSRDNAAYLAAGERMQL